jgi:histidinol-phosphate aminotransferase
LQATNNSTKLVFLCSPNNPTGNSLNSLEIEKVINGFNGLVVLDEAYIDFSEQPSYLAKLKKYPNLVVLQTFSKAWGLASIRLGMAFASPQIIALLNKIKYPYNINLLTQQYALEAIDNVGKKTNWVNSIIKNRTVLSEQLKSLTLVKFIYPTDANFLLIKVDEPNRVYDYLVSKGIIVRNRNTVSLCAGCLRITIGTEAENTELVEALKTFK